MPETTANRGGRTVQGLRVHRSLHVARSFSFFYFMGIIQTYQKPELISYGNVQELTSASADSDRQDRIFNADGVQVGNSSTGSLDQCFFRPGTTECIIQK